MGFDKSTMASRRLLATGCAAARDTAATAPPPATNSRRLMFAPVSAVRHRNTQSPWLKRYICVANQRPPGQKRKVGLPERYVRLPPIADINHHAWYVRFVP